MIFLGKMIYWGFEAGKKGAQNELSFTANRCIYVFCMKLQEHKGWKLGENCQNSRFTFFGQKAKVATLFWLNE